MNYYAKLVLGFSMTIGVCQGILDLKDPFPHMGYFSLSAMRQLYECDENAPEFEMSERVNQTVVCSWLQSRGACTHENAIEMRDFTNFDMSLMVDIVVSALPHNASDSEPDEQDMQFIGEWLNATALYTYHTLYHACQHWSPAIDCLWDNKDQFELNVRECGPILMQDPDYAWLQNETMRLKGLTDENIKSGDIKASILRFLKHVSRLGSKGFECVRVRAERTCFGGSDVFAHEMTMLNMYMNLSHYAYIDLRSEADPDHFAPKPLPTTPEFPMADNDTVRRLTKEPEEKKSIVEFFKEAIKYCRESLPF